MRVELTVEEAEELRNDFWLVDGVDPLVAGLVAIGVLGEVLDEDDNLVGYAMAHPALDFEDDIVIREVLRDRSVRAVALRRLPEQARAAGLLSLREGERAAGRSFRGDFKTDTAVAALIAAKREELENAGNTP